MQMLFSRWQKARKEVMECGKSQRKELSVIPSKLSFYYFYNGELCKAVVCLLDYVELVQEDTLAMEAAIRWMIFLGETELAEKKIKKWKIDVSSKELVEATKLGIGYIKAKELREENMKKLITLRDKVRQDNVRSFPGYELSSYLHWICSTLSNVPVTWNLEGIEFPDRLSQLQEATAKADAIIRNRVPGLATYQFDNSVSASIWPFLEGKHHGTPTEYVHLGSAIAWHFEMRREWALVNISTAQGRDSVSAMILNLRTALKSVSLFRIIQAANGMAYYTSVVGEPGSDEKLKIMKASCLNLCSTQPIIVHCSTPIKNNVPSRAQTPCFGRKSAPPVECDTLVQEITDQMAELELISEQPFHPITSSCECAVCLQYQTSSTFAAEYQFAYSIYSDFSQETIKQFNAEFMKIRERDMMCQALMHRDSSVRPRPNVIQNEVFGLCVIQWLIRKIDAKKPADEDSLEIFKNALKIVKYLPGRHADLFLAVAQLGRQLEFPQDFNYSWMQPVVRKPLVKVGLLNAVDLFRAVSPFGRREKSAAEESKPVNEQRFEAAKLAMRDEMRRYGHVLYREWRCRMFPYIGRTSDNPWEAAYAWAESTSIGSRNAVQSRLERCRKGLVTISGPNRFKKCVEAMPDDMTLVQVAMADNKQIYLIKLHADREPIIMPLAHFSQAVELMDKFTFLLEEDERIAKYPGEMSPDDFWKKRKAVDNRMMLFVEEVQKNFLDVAASLLMPSGRLGPAATELAGKLHRLSKGGLHYGEAKELVYLSRLMDPKSWEKLCLRFCEMRTKDPKFAEYLPSYHSTCLDTLDEDKKNNKSEPESSKKYTYLVICPHLSQFCWERLPIFHDFPYVGRQVSIHSTFSQLEAMRNQEKQIPLQIDVQNAYYVLDPENNLGETKRRMLEYITKFSTWQGTVGAAPNSSEITTALAKYDAFFYFGHGSGSSVMPRSVIKHSTCNAISMLMGCGSVRTVPQAHGFDGKSALLDYAMAKCPLIVGCLWTVTDGEIDRFLMRMVDDCFEKTRTATGVDKLRQLSEAMYEARSKAKLKYLTGAAVVMYGLPVVSKQKEVSKKENLPIEEDRELVEIATPKRLAQTPKTERVLKKSQQTEVIPQTSMHAESALKSERINEAVPKTPKQSEHVLKTSEEAENIPKTPKQSKVASKIQKTNEVIPKTPRQSSSASKLPKQVDLNPRTPPCLAAPKTPRATTRSTLKAVIPTEDELEKSSGRSMRTRSSARTPSRSRQT
ncbi:unnamed protein product [Caenorhabditis sp. 36 PRJEB53466]|nr:unnamed protein product [Caenorhabditis sp. 36 PRJEB53466]